jgi:hypothetical protein
VAWLSELTGIAGLEADRGLEGGGLHQTERGGFLNIHADFTHHHRRPGWRRRCNLILYLNEGWKDEWGGALEFWDAGMRGCVARHPPRLNHAVVFTTGPASYHGYPEPIRPPPAVTRKSLALYYYTPETDPAAAPRSTRYRARPGDGFRVVGVWLDNRLLALYSRLKRAFGLSDRPVSKLLGFLRRRK